MDTNDPNDDRPWWDKALDVLRYEASAFRFLLWTIGVVVVLMALVFAVRAVF